MPFKRARVLQGEKDWNSPLSRGAVSMPFKRARVLQVGEFLSQATYAEMFQCPLSGQGYCRDQEAQLRIRDCPHVSMPFKRARVLQGDTRDYAPIFYQHVSMPFKRARVLRAHDLSFLILEFDQSFNAL